MPTSTRHSARARKGAASHKQEANAPASDETLDTVLRDCSQAATKEQLGWEIATGSALLRCGQQLRQAQLEASRTAQQAYEDAASSLKKAHDIGELTNIHASLARSDFEGALRLWVRMSELATQSAVEVWNESASGAARLQNAAWSGALQWFAHQTSVGKRSDVLEAEVEHVTNTVAATPLVWPSQEATRQAMTFATSAWNDLLNWQGSVAQAAQAAGNGAAHRAQH